MVGVAAHLKVYARRFVVFVQVEFHLLLVKAQRAFSHSRSTKFFRHTVEGANGLVEISLLPFRMIVLDNLLCLFVGKSAVTMDRSTAKPAVVHRTFFVHFKDGTKRVFILIRSQ